MDKYPIEISCPSCCEVVILVKNPIPASTLRSDIYNYIDTPMLNTDNVYYCAACKKHINVSFIDLMKAKGL
jgi:hypothetical protein